MTQERMSPEERAWTATEIRIVEDVLRGVGGAFSPTGMRLIAAIRAAEAEGRAAAMEERDAEWRNALLPVAVCIECNEAFGFAPFVRPECRYCAPLRSLLDAGRAAGAPNSSVLSEDK